MIALCIFKLQYLEHVGSQQLIETGVESTKA